MFTLDTPFTLLVTHPVTFGLVLVALYLACYLPGMTYTPAPRTTPPARPRMGAWVDAPAAGVSLAYLPYSTPVQQAAPVQAPVQEASVEAAHARNCACAGCHSERVGIWASAHSQDWIRAEYKHTRPQMSTETFTRLCDTAFAPHVPTWGYAGSVDEVPVAVPAQEDEWTPTSEDVTRLEGLLDSIHEGGLGASDLADEIGNTLADVVNALGFPVAPVVKIEHKITSTERMRALRARYAAQGLTARGTQPLPVCEGVTKTGAACKRKAQTGTTTCTLDHANTDSAIALWM